MGDVEIILQSLVFLSTWLIFIFSQGSKFLIQQGSLASAAECVMLQTISRESFERTITIAKGNSSLGKFLIFHIHLSSQTPGQEEILNIVSMSLSVDKIIDVVKFRIGFFLSILKKCIYLFIYFWLCWVFVSVHGLFLVATSGGYSSLRCAGFSLQWLLSLRSTGSRCARTSVVVACGLSSCDSRTPEHRLSSCGAWA